MRKIKITKGKSFAIGKLPEGCRLCIEGKKSVLFMTGVCRQKCFYCTISEKRWQKNGSWINERLIKKDSDLISEIELSNSCGAGITGGEPFLVLDKIAHYIKLLKENFGEKFHIHLYTSGIGVGEKHLERVYSAGLDEIRIHLNPELVKAALKFGWDVGMEIPAIPKEQRKIKNLVDFLESAGGKFLNINELEFSERNILPFQKLGFAKVSDSMTAVKGSRETAEKVLEYAEANAKKLNLHFCTAALKLNYQLRNRLARRAKNIKKDFETVTKDGFLLKGIIFGKNLTEIKNGMIASNIPENMFFVSQEKGRIETSVSVAKKLAGRFGRKFKCAVVEEYPSAEPWDFELTPLNY
ncbi:MAG: radical SAM protein [Nanoarchaeota archaeon]|nr:radical SAM protein [Nanoarchaeota archaeon]